MDRVVSAIILSFKSLANLTETDSDNWALNFYLLPCANDRLSNMTCLISIVIIAGFSIYS